MRSFLLFLLQLGMSVGASMEWCEYWTLLDQKENHPECDLFTNSKESILRKIGRFPEEQIQTYQVPPTLEPYEGRVAVASPPRCENDREVVDCLECESSCASPNPVCNRDVCSRGCVCAGGYVREKTGDCIPVESCPLLPTEKEAKIYIDNVKRYMPVLVNDLWKYLFGVDQPQAPIVNSSKILSALFSDHFSRRKHF